MTNKCRDHKFSTNSDKKWKKHLAKFDHTHAIHISKQDGTDKVHNWTGKIPSGFISVNSYLVYLMEYDIKKWEGGLED